MPIFFFFLSLPFFFIFIPIITNIFYNYYALVIYFKYKMRKYKNFLQIQLFIFLLFSLDCCFSLHVRVINSPDRPSQTKKELRSFEEILLFVSEELFSSAYHIGCTEGRFFVSKNLARNSLRCKKCCFRGEESRNEKGLERTSVMRFDRK